MNPDFSNGEQQIIDGFNHTFYPLQDKIIVISQEDEELLGKFANFGFYFIFMWLVLQLFVIAFLTSRNFKKKYNSVSITTKIQLMVNLLIILPLFIVSATLINVERGKYMSELDTLYLDRIEPVSNCLKDYFGEGLSKFERKEIISECARNHQVDINIFGLDGFARDYSQTLLKDRNLYADLINPAVLERMESFDHLILDENVGEMDYRALYFPIVVNKERQGIAHIPFFESRSSVNQKMAIYLTRILAIFIGVFFLVTLISYWASRSFSKPLSMLATRLNKVSLDQNTPILWDSNDEIGLLVREYNAMISKLEDSRRKLSKQEKESAWKEMAQQVAHEIKNPLTPMRLSLQMMERKLEEEDAPNEKHIRTLNTVISQIDTLNEIAISFASFARMPEPTYANFDLVPVLEEVTSLYNESAEVAFKNGFGATCFIHYDQKTLSRVVTNLILNGIQATDVDGDAKAQIIVSMDILEKNQCLVAVQDFGTGIPEEVQKKVFVPNFSTKFAGSGIGLALAKNSIEEAGGQIYFETKEGEGTTFFIKLPFVN